MHTGRVIRLVEGSESGWSAIDTDGWVASQRPSTEGDLENLDDALELTAGPHADESPTPEPDAPWFTKGQPV